MKHSPLAHLAAAARLALISTFDMLLIMAHGVEKKMSCAAKERHFRWLVMVLCQPASLSHTGFLSALIPSIAPGAHKKASVQSIRSLAHQQHGGKMPFAPRTCRALVFNLHGVLDRGQ